MGKEQRFAMLWTFGAALGCVLEANPDFRPLADTVDGTVGPAGKGTTGPTPAATRRG
jgi:hypothetical protein